ncbi:matrixin family metalloprotease [Terrabacter sp. MAHUQ-38]|uniref:matrixin family metalloprotease n=1 Tax=unclassified Terrabacter TaxID=2630222 RepID=UPI00165D3093|nr:matrixin family metalloprotease [Terrabacter sp. MAHUQ-38]MBC9820255.1 matrixin family metalloprotease [Terrabacter sp. MAHUQ-38]
MRQGSYVRAPGRHRAASPHPSRRRWPGVAVLAVLVLAVPVWLWQARPFDARHGLGVDSPPAGIGAAQAPLGAPPTTPSGHGGYTFMRLQPSGTEPVAYDPCRPIHFTTSSVGLPTGGDALVRDAVATMSLASGLRFVDDGLTDEAPTPERDPYQPDRYGDRWAPVYIAFATPEQIPRLAGGTVGLGGSTPRAARDGVLVYVTGTVWLDRDAMTDLLRAGRVDSARAVIEHEIGHVLGLNHVSDSSQLMSESGGSVNGPADGDRRGLAVLGRGVCRPDL